MDCCPRVLIVGNWKMHGLGADLQQAVDVAEELARLASRASVVICPPSTLLSRMSLAAQGTPLELGGQDCHRSVSGAFTGDLSAQMLAEAGAAYVILGHSERRAQHMETSTDVAEKALAAVRAGLTPIICVGEGSDDRERGRTLQVLGDQLLKSVSSSLAGARLCVAYEPCWAIGTGRTPSTAQISEAHGFLGEALRDLLGEAAAAVPILYGGSVNPDNALPILAARHVGGLLVGGASLSSVDFLKIVRAADAVPITQGTPASRQGDAGDRPIQSYP